MMRQYSQGDHGTSMSADRTSVMDRVIMTFFALLMSTPLTAQSEGVADASAGKEAGVGTPMLSTTTTASPLDKAEIPPVTRAKLTIIKIAPNPVIGSSKPQRIVLRGTGFAEGCRVALSRNGEIEVLSGKQVQFLSNKELAIDVTTGEVGADWAVLVGTPDNRRSNMLQFRITPPEAKPQKSIKANPGSGVVTKTKVTVKADAVPDDSTPRKRILNGDWLAAQPKHNYTLQLVASRSQNNVKVFASEHQQLPAPLASFVADNDGTRMYVLTQGSYPSRKAAEEAAREFPQEIKPWPRSMESVQKLIVKQVVNQPNEAGRSSSQMIKDTAWVWSQNPRHYTIQLSAAQSEASIESVMHNIALPLEIVVVQTLREGKPWYALIYGSFASEELAKQSIERLPEALQKPGPWPRSFASLHDEISSSTRTP